MPRPLCNTCANVGQVTEYRLLWKEKREDAPPVKCSRRVESALGGWQKAKELPAQAFEIDVVSCARNCPNCRKSESPATESPARSEKPEEESASGMEYWWQNL